MEKKGNGARVCTTDVGVGVVEGRKMASLDVNICLLYTSDAADE